MEIKPSLFPLIFSTFILLQPIYFSRADTTSGNRDSCLNHATAQVTKTYNDFLIHRFPGTLLISSPDQNLVVFSERHIELYHSSAENYSTSAENNSNIFIVLENSYKFYDLVYRDLYGLATVSSYNFTISQEFLLPFL